MLLDAQQEDNRGPLRLVPEVRAFSKLQRSAPAGIPGASLDVTRLVSQSVCMIHVRRSTRACRQDLKGFTLAEVVISVGLAALTFTGVIYGYAVTSDQAQWSSCSLAALSLAVEGV